MTFKLEINCDNAAFMEDDHDGYAPAPEIARILREAAMHVQNGSTERKIYDANGNACGQFTLA